MIDASIAMIVPVEITVTLECLDNINDTDIALYFVLDVGHSNVKMTSIYPKMSLGTAEERENPIDLNHTGFSKSWYYPNRFSLKEKPSSEKPLFLKISPENKIKKNKNASTFYLKEFTLKFGNSYYTSFQHPIFDGKLPIYVQIKGTQLEAQNAKGFGYGIAKGSQSRSIFDKWAGIMAGSDYQYLDEEDQMPYADDDANWLYHELNDDIGGWNMVYVIQGSSEIGYVPRLPYMETTESYLDDSDYLALLDTLAENANFGDKVLIWVATHGEVVWRNTITGAYKYGLIFGTSKWKTVWWEQYFTNRVEPPTIRSKLLAITEDTGEQNVFYWMVNCKGKDIFDKVKKAGDISGLLTWYSKYYAHQYMWDYQDEFDYALEFEVFEQYEFTRALNGNPSIFDAVKISFETSLPYDVLYEYDELPFYYWL
jgi:hypothetical protein